MQLGIEVALIVLIKFMLYSQLLGNLTRFRLFQGPPAKHGKM